MVFKSTILLSQYVELVVKDTDSLDDKSLLTLIFLAQDHVREFYAVQYSSRVKESEERLKCTKPNSKTYDSGEVVQLDQVDPKILTRFRVLTMLPIYEIRNVIMYFTSELLRRNSIGTFTKLPQEEIAKLNDTSLTVTEVTDYVNRTYGGRGLGRGRGWNMNAKNKRPTV